MNVSTVSEDLNAVLDILFTVSQILGRFSLIAMWVMVIVVVVVTTVSFILEVAREI